MPSIEVIAKLAKFFEVSVDYLIGEETNASYDKEIIDRLEGLQNLPAETKKQIFDYTDLVIRDNKTKQTYKKIKQAKG